jgi:hypothetical protein
VRRSPAQTVAASFLLCGTERNLGARSVPKRGFHTISVPDRGVLVLIYCKNMHVIENIMNSKYNTHNRDVLLVFCKGT